MSKETVYHGRQDDVQSVHSMYEVTERDGKLKPGRKVLVGGLFVLFYWVSNFCSPAVDLPQQSVI